MNKAGVMRKNLLTLFFCMIAGIFVSSCGLEEVITVTEPTVTHNNPLYSSSDPESWYFNFKTSGDDGDNFVGTGVYYKIYNNSSTLTSEKSSILSVNTSANSSAAATRMIETYKYQQLVGGASGDAVMFSKDIGAVSVIMRLKDYQHGLGQAPSQSDTTAYNNYIESKKNRYKWEACIGTLAGSEYSYYAVIPYRSGGNKTFDFFDYDENNKGGTRDVLPADGDEDYKHSASSSDSDAYFVQMFAVGIALDPNTTSPSYSLVLDLGSVPIRKGE